MSHPAAESGVAAAATRHRRQLPKPTRQTYVASLVIMAMLFVSFFKSNQASFQALLAPSLQGAVLSQGNSTLQPAALPKDGNSLQAAASQQGSTTTQAAALLLANSTKQEADLPQGNTTLQAAAPQQGSTTAQETAPQQGNATLQAAPSPQSSTTLKAAALPQSNTTLKAAPLPRGDNSSYVSMCIAVKDEHCDIREWILYHASIGAAKFYLFDTDSKPPMRPVLEDLIQTGLVQYHFLTNKSLPGYPNFKVHPGNSLNWQSPVFRTCLQRYGQRHRWMAFIDVDEFISLRDGVASLPDLLKRHEAHPGLVLHWRFFSFDGHIDRPAQGVLSSYTACCRRKYVTHRTIKSIVQPSLTKGPSTTHDFAYKKGGRATNTNGTIVPGTLVDSDEEVSYKEAALYHYGTKSLSDFALKMQRRGGAGGQKKLDYFLEWHHQCTERCREMVPLGQQLLQRYNLTKNVPRSCVTAPARKPP